MFYSYFKFNFLPDSHVPFAVRKRKLNSYGPNISFELTSIIKRRVYHKKLCELRN